MRIRILALSTGMIVAGFASALPGQRQSIAESVAQLKSDVASLQQEVARKDQLTNVPFVMQGIDFSPGIMEFKNANGAAVSTIGDAADGSGGLWLNNVNGQPIFSVSTMAGKNAGMLTLDDQGGGAAAIVQAQPSGDGVARFLHSGKVEATIGGDASGIGGAVWLADASGNDIAFIGADVSGHGMVQLTNSNGTDFALLKQGVQSGGDLYLFNSSGKVVVAMGNDAKEGGTVGFFNSSGNAVASIGTNKDDDSRGSVWAAGQDYAETFEPYDRINGIELTPGSVVSASTDGGGIVLSRRSYDPKVVGVLSGAQGLHPALVVGEESNSPTPPVAIAGQVYVRVSSEGGVIRVGDLLVSSNSPGVAMRATNLHRANGATIGKALQNYNSVEVGYIRMLVLNR